MMIAETTPMWTILLYSGSYVLACGLVVLAIEGVIDWYNKRK